MIILLVQINNKHQDSIIYCRYICSVLFFQTAGRR